MLRSWLLLLSLVTLGSSSNAQIIFEPLFTAKPFDFGVAGTSPKTEVQWSPCSDHLFVLDKGGLITVTSTTPHESGFVYDISDDVFDYSDHGAHGLQIHPDFPEQPYIFVFYSAEGTNPDTGMPWGDSCPRVVDGSQFCQTSAKLIRLELDVSVDAGSGACRRIGFEPAADNPYLLKQDWCSSSIAHTNDDIKFYGNDLLLSAGDLSLTFDVLDVGIPGADGCYDPAMKMPQGKFRAQRMDFLAGKLIRISGESLFKTKGQLELGTDFSIVASGLRNPYGVTVDRNMNVYVGNVGNTAKEEINMITKKEMADTDMYPYNMGWPCLEGTKYVTEVAEQNWMMNECDPATAYSCDICHDIWPCASNAAGEGGCSKHWKPPAFQFRNVPLDYNYPDECQQATSAMTGLAFLDGGLPQFAGSEGASRFPYSLIASDFGTGCMFTFGVNEDETPDFAGGAQLLVTDHKAHFLQRGKDGYLYSATTERFTTLWQHGVKTATDEPTARLDLFVINGTTGDVILTCDSGVTCQVPLGATIRLDAGGSTPGGAEIASYYYEFGFGDAISTTNTTVDRAYPIRGLWLLYVTVTDAQGQSSFAKAGIAVDYPFEIVTSPPPGQWRLGDTIELQVMSHGIQVATTKWDATIYHCGINKCSGEADCHTHTNGVDAGFSTNRTSYLTPPIHDLPSYMEITVTAIMPWGRYITVATQTHSMVYNTTIRAAVGGGHIPAVGFVVENGAVDTCTTPCVKPYMALGMAALKARPVQAKSAYIYKFVSWTQTAAGGGASMPAGATPRTAVNGIRIGEDGLVITANYQRVYPAVSAATPPLIVAARGAYGLIEVLWTVPFTAAYDYVVVSVVSERTAFDHSVVVIAAGDPFTTVDVPAAAANYTVKLAGYDYATNERTGFGAAITATTLNDEETLCYSSPGPYNGAVANIPGAVEFEAWMAGAPGVAYSDASAGNDGGAESFRAGTDVDVRAVNGSSGGYSVVRAVAGEWLLYEVSVAATRNYDVALDVFSLEESEKSYFINIDSPACDVDAAVARFQQAGKTRGFETIRAAKVPLTAGPHLLRFCVDAGDFALALDRMTFTA